MKLLSLIGIPIIGIALATTSAAIVFLVPTKSKNDRQPNSENNARLILMSCEAVGGDLYPSCCTEAVPPFDCHKTLVTATTETQVTSFELYNNVPRQTCNNTSVSNPMNSVNTTSILGPRSAGC